MGDLNIAESIVRVLVIEDDQNDRELLLYHLRKSKMDEQVKFIGDGREALDFLTDLASQPDKIVAIFLDLNLPSLGGLELLRKLRAEPKMRDIPVIVKCGAITGTCPGDS